MRDHIRYDDIVLGGAIENSSRFGHDVAQIGDVNGDGFPDIAVGARQDTSLKGAVWILLLDEDGDLVPPSPFRIGDAYNDLLNLLTLEVTSGSNLGSLFGDGIARLPTSTGTASTRSSSRSAPAAPIPAPRRRTRAPYLVDLETSGFTIREVVTIASGSTNFTTLGAETRSGLAVRNLGD